MPMLRMVAVLVIGMIIGAVVALGFVAIPAGSGIYEYHLAGSESEARAWINTYGWEIVPNQPNPMYMRQPRWKLCSIFWSGPL
jgi:hypothetical protein